MLLQIVCGVGCAVILGEFPVKVTVVVAADDTLFTLKLIVAVVIVLELVKVAVYVPLLLSVTAPIVPAVV